MQDYVKLAGGAVCTAVEATATDLRPSEAPFLYSRQFLAKGARVRIAVTIDGEEVVIFDDTLTPKPDMAAVVEVRVRRHPDIDPRKVPPDPATAQRIEDGVVQRG
jgi:hypothetical protein